MSKLWCVRPITFNNELKPIYIPEPDYFFNHEIISPGLPFTGDLTDMKKKQLKDVLKLKYGKLSDSLIGQYTKSLERFRFEFNIGDYVIFPQFPDQFSIGKVTSDYQYISSSDISSGYPHIRQIKWIKVGLVRIILSMGLRKSFGSPSPVFDISQHYQEIQKIVEDGNPQVIERKTLNVTYPLRPDYIVAFKVPSNMTKQEAERLSDFIKTIFYQ